MKKLSFVTCLLLLFVFVVNAQEHNFNNSYVKPTDTLVQQKIAQWQDLKFGLFMH